LHKGVGCEYRKRFAVTFVLLTGALLVMSSPTRVARLDAPDAFAIRDVQIVTGAGRTIAKGTVVFRTGLITDVGESVRIPADARVIDGTGMTVYPGLIDSFTNLGIPPQPQPQTPRGAGGGGGRRAAWAAAAAGQQPNPDQALGDPSLS